MAEATSPAELFSLARLRVTISWPLLAPAVWALHPPIAVTDLTAKCGGAFSTDTRWRVYYDPAVLPSLTPGQVATALVHEVWHCLRHHGARADALAVEPCWLAALGAALDMEVNGDMESREHPPEWPYRVYLPRDVRKPRGLPFADYFPAACELVGPRPVCYVGGSSMGGPARAWELSDGPALGPAEREAIRRGVAQAIAASGGASGGLLRWAAEVLAPPKVPWQSVLAQLVRHGAARVSGATDYTRSVPSRRQGVTSVVLPALRKPECWADVVLDTSGSMGEDELLAACAEVEGVVRATGSAVRLYACDVRVVGGMQRVQRAADIGLHGGGGTDMMAGIKFAEAVRPRAAALVVLTDGQCVWDAGHRPAIPAVIVGLVGAYHVAPEAIPGWAHALEVQ